jgi:hypothetical protein
VAARWEAEPAAEPRVEWAAPARAALVWGRAVERWEAAPAHPEEVAAVPVTPAQELGAAAAVPPWEVETWREGALEWEAAARADRVREWEAQVRANQAQEWETRAVRAQAPEWDRREAGPRRAADQWVASKIEVSIRACLLSVSSEGETVVPLRLAEGSGTTLGDGETQCSKVHFRCSFQARSVASLWAGLD